MAKKNILTKAKKAKAERLALGDCLPEALELYASVCKTDPADVEALVKLAVIQCRLRQYGQAESSVRRALRLAPNLPFAQETLATILKHQGRADEASSLLEDALVRCPDSAEHLLNLGVLRDKQGRVEEAFRLYHRALDLQPDSPYVLAKKGQLLEKEGRVAEAEEIVGQGLVREPGHPDLNLLAARLDSRRGHHAQAADRLEAVLHRPMAPDTGAEIHILLGQLYDLTGNAGKVLPHLLEGKRRLALDIDPHGTVRSRFLAWVDNNRAWLDQELAGVAQPATTPPEETPVFLVGFPRSGTTLLEQVLDSHPSLQALNEKPMGEMMEDAFHVMTKGRPNSLANLSDGQIADLRQVYWREAARHGDRQADTLLVDKQPFNIIRVPLLWRVFPRARFILAVRHPCDVVLGCLMQKFGFNNLMSAFANLEDTAELYTRVMDAWLDATRRLPLRWQRIRYEDLVTNFETETRALLEFLGVGWSDAVLAHTEHARQRGIINTPSYHQVTQPIYQHAKYRWKRHESAFAALMPRLSRFIDEFGYRQQEAAN
jgi:tetratricopeptide (TPR) repeat protein